MKKFLALVLALVMTMSLVTISAGAEDFTDADSMNYAEAVEVMSAVGVVGGYADGSFNPTAGLTRGAAAKIICNMILGPTTAEALSADAAPYSDVAVDNVFAGYIAYCAKEGIISGYADGTFRPAAPLTGYAFMKMLLGALGYDPAIEGYTGANWSINVAKQALAIELDAGLKGDFAGTKALTREEACLYAFNTLKATMVDYGNKSTISVGDITISTSADAKAVVNNAATETIKNDDYMQFAEKYFSKLTKTAKVADEYGRPANTWKYDKDVVGTFVNEEPVAVYVEGFDATELKALNDEYYFTSTKVVFNGYEQYPAVTVADLAARDYTGTVVELYTNDDGDTVDLIVVVQDYFAQVTFEDEDSITLKIYNPWGSPASETFVDNTKKADDMFDKLSAAYDKDDYLRVYYEGADLAKNIIEFAAVEAVEGEIATSKVDVAMNGYVTVDGVKYTFASGYMNNTELTVTGEYKLFLDANGYVIGSEVITDAAAIEDVYYVAHAWTKTVNAYGESAKTEYYVQLVDMEGNATEVQTEVSYASLKNDLVTMSDKKWTSGGTTYKAGNEIYDLAVWVNADWDQYDGLTTSEFKKDTTRMSISGKTYRFNAETKYILVEGTGSALDVTAKVGGVALASGKTAIIVTADDSALAKYVIVYAADLTQGNTFAADDLVYVASASTEKGDGYRVQKVYKADGSTENLKVDASEYPALTAGFYAYDTNEDGYVVFDTTDVAALATGLWDDEKTGVLTGVTYHNLYETLLTVRSADSSKWYTDVETAEAVVVDVHDTTASGQYSKTISSVQALADMYAKEGYTTTCALALNVDETGAVTIFVTSLTHSK